MWVWNFICVFTWLTPVHRVPSLLPKDSRERFLSPATQMKTSATKNGRRLVERVDRQHVSYLYGHQSVEPLLILMEFLTATSSVALLKPPELLRSPLLPLFHAHTASRQLAREGKLHSVNFALVKFRAAPLFQLWRQANRNNRSSFSFWWRDIKTRV